MTPLPMNFTARHNPRAFGSGLPLFSCVLAILGYMTTSCDTVRQANGSSQPEERATATHQAVIVNGGFESAALAPWSVTTNLNSAGITIFPPTKVADLGLTGGGIDYSNFVGSSTSGYPIPAGLTATQTLRFPFYGNYAAVVNQQGSSNNANTLSQTAVMSASDVDTTDGKIHLRFAAAPVLQNPSHTNVQQPYFFLDITNTTTNKQLFSTFNFSNQPGVNWGTTGGGTPALYTNWQAFDIAPSGGALNIGDSIKITAVAAGCSQGGHWGELYIDEFGTSFARPNVNVTAPAYTKASSPLTYTVTAKNGGGFAATNVVVTFATPKLTDSNPSVTTAASTDTTFASLSPLGLNCTTPTVGAAGTITCNLGTIAAGGSNTFTVTVNVPSVPGGYISPYWINAGTYGITSSEQTTALSGNLVQTRVTTDTPVDLQTTLSDGVASSPWGQTDTYTLTVKNNGPVPVTGVSIQDTQPAAFSGTTWSCAATGSATCGAGTGSGAINTTANLPVGDSVTFTVITTVNGSGAGKVVYTALATPPTGYAQLIAFNNTATDVNNNDDTLYTLTADKDPAGTGQGTTILYPGGFTCGAGCSTVLPKPKLSNNTSIAITASPAAGSAFMGWSGGACSGRTNPCVVSITADTTITAKFNQASVTPTITATSNSNSTNLRPGDTVDYSIAFSIPAGFNWPFKATHVLPTGLDFVSLSSPPSVGGTLTCSVGTCTNPTAVTGATSSLDFGTIACSTAADCSISYTLRGRISATATRGTLSAGTVAATNVTSSNLPVVAVIEPELGISRSPSTTTGLLPSDTSTVTVTLTNTGSANTAVVGAVVTAPTPTHLTASNYQAGTCPSATPSFGASSATFTFASNTSFAVGSSCYFTYDLTVASSAPGNTAISVGSASFSTQSISGTAPPAKVYSASDSSFSLSTASYANGEPCTSTNNCTSGACGADNMCGYGEGDGPCTNNNAGTVCRSGSCSILGLCGPLGGCLADGDCTSDQFCNTQTKACASKLANSTAIPSISGHNPVLNGQCSTSVGTAVCVSAVCDTADDKCGYADGDGTCTAQTAAVVCRSGDCLKSGACGTAGVCLEDSDCDASHYCNTPTKTCVAKLDNGTAIPTVVGHTPTLDAQCTSLAATAVCVTAVCDVADNKCGYADGDGPCGSADPSICRSGTCAKSGVCGGCGVDSDCTSTQYCNTPTHECVTKVINGNSVPTVNGHSPVLGGVCTSDAAEAACQSGVCDTDDKCGLANGAGPCQTSNGAVCRSGVCWAASDVCGEANGCASDADCGALQYCDTALKTCTAKLGNGTSIPTIAGHTPALDGTCSNSIALAVCSSAVCDPVDNRCGYADGDGTCGTGNSALDPAKVCRSSVCSVSGVCGVANGGCIVDGDCAASQYCSTPDQTCVPKLPNGALIPTVTGHFPTLDGHCSQDVQAIVCQSLVCDPADNKCGYADGEGACTDATALSVCRSGVCSKSGACGVADGCLVDSDCSPTQYCNTPQKACAPKVVNGSPIPAVTGHVPTLDASCSLDAATAACVSAVCDIKDNRCGLDNGSGPCTEETGATVCRSAACDKVDGVCGYGNGIGPCTSNNAAVVCRSKNCSLAGVCSSIDGCYVDADCSTTQFCNTETNSCIAKLTNGASIPTVLLHDPVLNGACSAPVGNAVCESGLCDSDNKCGMLDGSGPCTLATATVICRSGKCSSTGVCGTDVINNGTGGTSSMGGATSLGTGGITSILPTGGASSASGGASVIAATGGTQPSTGGTTFAITSVTGGTRSTGGASSLVATGGTSNATGGAIAATGGALSSTGAGSSSIARTGSAIHTAPADASVQGGGGFGCRAAHSRNNSGGVLVALALLGLRLGQGQRRRRNPQA